MKDSNLDIDNSATFGTKDWIKRKIFNVSEERASHSRRNKSRAMNKFRSEKINELIPLGISFKAGGHFWMNTIM